MRIRRIQLRDFKRFDDLTIDLGNNPQKIIALVGPNGCGKSSIFDAFEERLKNFRNHGSEGDNFLSKALYAEDENTRKDAKYERHVAVSIDAENGEIGRKSFYIRTAYRFTSKINVQQLSAMPDILSAGDEPISSIALDTRLESNYKRLLGSSYTEFFTGKRTGDCVREELIGNINKILKSVIDAEISDLGDILNGKGQFYFRKGGSVNFPYANLSSGEKEVVDIVIDLLIKSKEYDDTVFCIDEPELHLNTAIQRKLLVEIEKIVPDTCQLWVATHSIGFLRALQDELKEKSQIIDFSSGEYFTGTHTVKPMVKSRANWQRIFGSALEDLTGLISPRRIIYCEGRDMPGQNGQERGLDAKVFNTIFSENYNDTLFISSGGNTELDQRSEIALKILTKVFSDVEILVLKDRDIESSHQASIEDRAAYLAKSPGFHRVLKRFELENYLFDKEVLMKYCISFNRSFDEVLYDAEVTDINNQPVKDIIGKIKDTCGIRESIGKDRFKLDLAAQISKDMEVYRELESCIF